MVEGMNKDVYSEIYVIKSNEDEQQREKDGDQGNEMWDPDQELDDGWEVKSQKRWQKTQDIWDDDQDEWENKNKADKD